MPFRLSGLCYEGGGGADLTPASPNTILKMAGPNRVKMQQEVLHSVIVLGAAKVSSLSHFLVESNI